MAFLQNLPPEILDLILRDSHLAVTLWQCGNHGLNRRLSSGITELSLHYFPYKELSLPKLVLELPKLKSLELYASKSLLEEMETWSYIRAQLPRTLESLTIDFDSDQVFLDFDSAGFVEGDYVPNRNHGYISIESILPNLQNLELKRSRLQVHRSFLSSLPPSLTSLTIDNGNFTLPFMSLLPPNIKYLDLNANWSTYNVTDVETQPCFDDLASTPPGLILEQLRTNLTAKQLSLAQFPPGLRSSALWVLHQHPCPPSIVAQLPRTLTRLEFGCPLGWSPFSNIEGSGSESGLVHSCWPPSLQSLVIELNTYKRGTVAALPRQIKSLRLTLRRQRVARSLLMNFLLASKTCISTLIHFRTNVKAHFQHHSNA